MEYKNPFAELQKQFNQMMDRFPGQIAEIAIGEFDENFRRQGFMDSSVTPWPARKSDRGSRRAILIRAGRLRRGFRNESTNDTAIVRNYTPYAQIHNEGGTINHPGGKRTLRFRQIKSGNREGRWLFSKRKRATFEQDVTVGPYNINMPKRQFMGNSANLDRQIADYIDRQLKQIDDQISKHQ